MAKGAETKEKLYNVLKQIFGDSLFKLDKEIRLNTQENGENIQIKIAFTCAKDIVGATSTGSVSTPVVASLEPMTEQEVADVKELILKLGL